MIVGLENANKTPLDNKTSKPSLQLDTLFKHTNLNIAFKHIVN